MALNRDYLKNFVIRKAKILNNDAASLSDVIDDMNFSLNIIAPKKDWPQLVKSNTLTTTANDGDISYPLQSDVDRVEQMLITSPQSYSREIKFMERELQRRQIPNKLIPGRTTPSRWYFNEPTLDTNNVATKNVSFNFRPDQAYTITYSYYSFAPTMDSTIAYPFFDPMYHLYPAYFAIWKYAERIKQPSLDPIYWRGEWENGLKTIEEDEQGDTKHLLPIPGPDTAA